MWCVVGGRAESVVGGLLIAKKGRSPLQGNYLYHKVSSLNKKRRWWGESIWARCDICRNRTACAQKFESGCVFYYPILAFKQHFTPPPETETSLISSCRTMPLYCHLLFREISGLLGPGCPFDRLRCVSPLHGHPRCNPLRHRLWR